jgi:hypothetical protein
MSISFRSHRVLQTTLVALLLLLTIPTYAATTYDLLRIDPTPRGSAMAGNSIALMNNDLNALNIHPGGLAALEHRQVSASYADHPLDVSGGYFGFGFPSDYGYAAFGLNYLNYGTFDRRTTLDEDPTGSFSPSDMLITAGFGREVVEHVGVGISVKYIRGEIDTYSSSAIAADVSAHWDTRFRWVELAAGISNIGTQLESYGETKEDLPTEAHLGVAKQLEHLPLKLSLTAHMDIDSDFWGALAGEFTVSPLLQLRAGYTTIAPDYHVEGSQDAISGVSAGLGLHYFDINLDYAFYSQGALGQVHRIGVGYLF